MFEWIAKHDLTNLRGWRVQDRLSGDFLESRHSQRTNGYLLFTGSQLRFAAPSKFYLNAYLDPLSLCDLQIILVTDQRFSLEVKSTL